VLVLLAVVACGGQQGGASNGTGTGGGPATLAGTAGLSNAGTSGAAVAGGGAGDGDTLCPETRPLTRVGGTQVALAFAPTLAGKPLVVGEANAFGGGQISPLNLRFYVSEVSLLAGDGTALPVDLVSPDGKPEPYGIHLVNFDEPTSTSLQVLAPAGTYSGARFTFGISDACNAGGSARKAPLSANSEMGWPHLAGFLFFRYEAQWTATAGADPSVPPPSMIHMGGVIGRVFAPQASISGALAVPATGTLARTVQVSFDEIFRAASSTEDVSNVIIPTPEVIAGERLRRAVPTLPIFSLVEP
jgi:hypothetical protein